jgi:hypothetical protein
MWWPEEFSDTLWRVKEVMPCQYGENVVELRCALDLRKPQPFVKDRMKQKGE